MRKNWILIACLVLSACNGGRPSPSPIEMNAAIKDIMDSMIDPSGDFLFESVAEIADEHGITQKAPRTDDEWKDVRNRAFVLFEGMNLVMMEGRKVAKPGDKSNFPEVELEPDQIQKLIDDDRPSFIRRAKKLQDAAALALAAADVKDAKALFGAIEHVDRACENCHLHYWYPKDSRAVEQAKKTGIWED